jgi:predicted GNAT family acetyltransferase
MKVRDFSKATDFLKAAGEELERNEAANGLLLGICGQLVRHPERFRQPVCLKLVEREGRPVLAAVMTPPQKLLLAGAPEDAEGAAAAVADALAAETWNVPGVFGPQPVAHPAASRLAQSAGKRCRLEQQLRMYQLTAVELPPPAQGRLRTASVGDLDRVTGWWHAARMEMFGRADAEESRTSAKFRVEDGDLFLWEDEEPVSMAIRTRPTRRGISVGMVFTPPERRRRGYATALVGELSRTLLAEGRAFCTLYADLANPTSNSIYRKIGYRPIVDMVEYAIVDGE